MMLLNVDMSGKKALVIGGGRVAHRKVEALLAGGAVVHVVAPAITAEIRDLEKSGRLTVLRRCYQTGDLDGASLVVSATDDADVNRQVSLDAASMGVMVCVADAPESGNCSFPAVLRRGGVEIGVSTGGSCPPLAVEIRDIVAEVVTEEYAHIGGLLEKEREKLLTEGNGGTYNAQVLRSIARQLISELNERKDRRP